MVGCVRLTRSLALLFLDGRFESLLARDPATLLVLDVQHYFMRELLRDAFETILCRLEQFISQLILNILVLHGAIEAEGIGLLDDSRLLALILLLFDFLVDFD